MIRLENISKYYHSEGVVALGLRKVSLEFNIGNLLLLLVKVVQVRVHF